jgi:hypothetical protein
MHVLVLTIISGCVTTNFVQTDAHFQGTEKSSLPPVFVDEMPAAPYRAVGIIEVVGPAERLDWDTLLAAAQEKGRDVGCDLVVDRAVHRISTPPRRQGQLVAAPRYFVASLSDVKAPKATAYAATAAPQGRKEFICGKYVAGAR